LFFGAVPIPRGKLAERVLIFLVAVTILAGDKAWAQEATLPAAPEDLTVLGGWDELPRPSEMMAQYLLAKVAAAQKNWQEAFEKRTDPQEIRAYQHRLREEFLRRIGGLPEERTPLNPQIVGRLQRRGYLIEKIIFESQPGHYVTAALFLPDPARYQPPYPGVVIACGHSDEAKAYPPYAGVSALMALHGLAAFIFDPIDQGERHQWRDPDGKFPLRGTAGHTMIGSGSILLGRNTAYFEIWDGIRAIDYLQSRPEVDPEKIGCTGISGGGTQTAYLMALDPRIKAAAPGCYLCSLYGRLIKTLGPQDAEQNIFGQLAMGMDHADYVMMRAPQPTLLLAATFDYFDIEDTWRSFRMAKRLYGRLGYPERVEIAETEAKHGFSVQLREAAVRWMLRWLAGREEEVFEPADLDVPSREDLQCTPEGEVMLLPGARSTYDLNRDFARKLAQQRESLWREMSPEQILARIRELAGIRPLDQIPAPDVLTRGEPILRSGYRIEKRIFRPEPGIFLPALLFVPTDRPSLGVVLYIHENGKAADAAPGGPIEQLAQQGKTVLAVDLRGTGETQRPAQRYFNPKFHGPDGQDFYVAYLLGLSYVGMRTEDILICARWLRELAGGNQPVDLVAVGYLGSAALHAAALESNLFGQVTLIRPLVSWHNVVELGFNANWLVNTVHGALQVYDLPDLARLLGIKLKVIDPRDALGRPLPALNE
jgi:dienelactone hydrolase